MNTETRDSISRAVDLLRGHLSVIDANQALMTDAKAVAARLDTRRVNLDARGQGASELSSLLAEIETINAHITKLGVKHQELGQALNQDLAPIYPQAQDFLRQLHEQSVAAAATRVRPLVGTDKEAQKEAEKTVECLAVRRALTTIGAGPWDRAEKHARIIVQYYEAALQGT